MAFELPPLPYDYSALEPTIDSATMKLHHDMHHAAYVKNLNAALEKYPNLQSKSAEDLIRDLNAVSVARGMILLAWLLATIAVTVTCFKFVDPAGVEISHTRL